MGKNPTTIRRKREVFEPMTPFPSPPSGPGKSPSEEVRGGKCLPLEIKDAKHILNTVYIFIYFHIYDVYMIQSPGHPPMVSPPHTYKDTDMHTYLHTFLLHSHLPTYLHRYINTYITLHCITIHYITLHYITIPYNTIQYHTIPYNTIQYHTIPYNTIQYHTIPYNTIQYHTFHTYLPTYLPTYLHTYLPTYMHACIHTYTYFWPPHTATYPNHRGGEIDKDIHGLLQTYRRTYTSASLHHDIPLGCEGGVWRGWHIYIYTMIYVL